MTRSASSVHSTGRATWCHFSCLPEAARTDAADHARRGPPLVPGDTTPASGLTSRSRCDRASWRRASTRRTTSPSAIALPPPVPISGTPRKHAIRRTMRPRWWLLLSCGLVALLPAAASNRSIARPLAGSAESASMPQLCPPTAPLPCRPTSCADDVCQDQEVDDYQNTWLHAENDQLNGDPVTAHCRSWLLTARCWWTPPRRPSHDVMTSTGTACGPLIWVAGCRRRSRRHSHCCTSHRSA